MLIYKNYDESKLLLYQLLKYGIIIFNVIFFIIIACIIIKKINFNLGVILFLYCFILGFYIYQKTMSVGLFEIHDKYIKSKSHIFNRWKIYQLDDVFYDYNYIKDKEYLNIYFDDKQFGFLEDDINNSNTINFITKNISKNIFHKKSWKFYLYNFLCFSPFIVYITFLSLINHKISSLQNKSIQENGYIQLNDKVKKINYNRGVSNTIVLKYNIPFDFSLDKDSIKYKNIEEGDSIQLLISPYEYKKKIIKTEPLKWYDKYFGYESIDILGVKKIK